MGMKYTVNINDDNIQALNDDPEMEGLTLDGIAADGTKVQVTILKKDVVSTEEPVEEPVEMQDEAPAMDDETAEVGNISPEEDAAMMNATEESVGFTNESSIASFDNFLKTR
jgi:hypothetical protein